MKLKKVLSICKANGLYYLYDRIDRSGEITQWLGDGYALYPLDGLPILDEESFCAVFDITGKQREKILFRHERLPEHLNVEDVAAGDKSAKCPAYYTPETDGLKSPWNLAGGGCILQPSIRARGWEMGSQSLRGSPARRNRRSSDSGPD